MSYDPKEQPELVISWTGRRAGKMAATEEGLRRLLHERLGALDAAMVGVRDRTGASLEAFREDLAIYGIAMIGADGQRIDPRKAILR
jgi:hypothetical protein